MTTFLAGVQDLCAECDLPSSPSTVVGQTGEFGDMVRWYARAWRDIQNRHPWRWLRRTATVQTVDGTSEYEWSDFTDTTDAAVISRFSTWRATDPTDPPKLYLTSSGVGGERWLIFTPWEWFKSVYRIGTQNDGAPAHISIDPANKIVLGPTPNGIYTLTLDYYRSPQELSANADIPEMPVQYHDLIIYAAMKKYAYREAAPEAMNRANEEYRRLMRQLEVNQLDPMTWPGPMA